MMGLTLWTRIELHPSLNFHPSGKTKWKKKNIFTSVSRFSVISRPRFWSFELTLTFLRSATRSPEVLLHPSRADHITIRGSRWRETPIIPNILFAIGRFRCRRNARNLVFYLKSGGPTQNLFFLSGANWKDSTHVIVIQVFLSGGVSRQGACLIRGRVPPLEEWLSLLFRIL